MMISLQLKQTQSTIISAVIANVVGFYHTYTSNLMHWEFTALVKSFCTGSTSSRRLKSVWRSLILVCSPKPRSRVMFLKLGITSYQKNVTRRLNSWRVCEFSLSGAFWLLDQICDQVFRICLFSPVDDILRERKASHAWPSNNAVMSRRCVSHLHGREL